MSPDEALMVEEIDACDDDVGVDVEDILFVSAGKGVADGGATKPVMGKETWKDGSIYEGQYRQGHKHGQGVYVWSDGSTYEGEWFNNKIHGQGAYTWADGRRYTGQWEENKMHGYG